MLEGNFTVHKVAGNFHVAMGRSKYVGGHLIHQIDPAQMANFNTSHRINHISFGAHFPGQQNPLGGISGVVDPHEMTTATFRYTINVVPTMYTGSGERVRSSQYTVSTRKIPSGAATLPTPQKSIHDHASHNAPMRSLPGVFFVYNISPFVVHTTVQYVHRIDFVARLCAIVGGAYALLGLLDSILYMYVPGWQR